jgi:hypothetical protein
MEMLGVIRNTIEGLCSGFVENPYLCYTEHGQHALFYTMLFNALSPEQRYTTWQNQKVCVLQKEYPTAAPLGKPKRQHWDIAVLKSPPESTQTGGCSYDFLKLLAVIEFGLNEAEEHLQDDINRLCHEQANLEHCFIVHLYRFSNGNSLFSHRDWSSISPRILQLTDICRMSEGKSVEIFIGLADLTGKYEQGVWNIHQGVSRNIFSQIS